MGKSDWGIGWDAGTTHNAYMGRFPFQVPYMLVLYACQQLAGENFAILAQLINAVSNGACFYLLCRIAYELTENDFVAFLTLGLALAFSPIVIYAAFIYGNLIAIPLILGAWLLSLKCGKQSEELGKKKKFFILLLASILVCVSILIKSTMNVFAIAFAIMVILHAIQKRVWLLLPVAFVPILLSSVLLESMVVPLETRMGTDMHNAIPKLTWIVMGIGGGREYEAEKDGNAISPDDLVWPGYCDSYVWRSPAEEGFDSWNELNSYALKLRLQRFASDPGYMLAFFARKLAIEWTEPTVECFTMSNWEGVEKGAFYSRYADEYRNFTRLGKTLYYGKANAILCYLSDLAQSLIAIGSLAWCLRAHKNHNGTNPWQLMSLLYVLGGALLYIFWENKSQYTLQYWVFLIPYSASGLHILSRYASEVFNKRVGSKMIALKHRND
ncbi:MAG: hypothetical protein IKF78_10515 [Atopobiaceae bacterium]|nr:hypothetical protein [Atopobiaceae bacterium]